MAQFAIIAAAAVAAYSAIRGGRAANAQAKSESEQLKIQGDNALASSTQSAAEQQRQARLAGSRAQAVAASSGGGASDPTVTKTISEIIGEGEYRALVDIYGGETQRNSAYNQAAVVRRQGREAERAGYLKAASVTASAFASSSSLSGGPNGSNSTVFSNGSDTSTIYGRFGGGGYGNYGGYGGGGYGSSLDYSINSRPNL
jgi:hypothetical protein